MSESNSLDLHAAVCCNDSEQLQALLESCQFNVNEKDTEWGYRTPLHWAAQKGYVECAKQLLDFEASGTSRMAYGATPAHVAAEAGKVLILKLFVKSKVSVTRTDDFGDRPVDRARIYGQKQCVDFLKQAEIEAVERRKARAEMAAFQRQKATAKSNSGKKKKSGLINNDAEPLSRTSSPIGDEAKSVITGDGDGDYYNSDEDIDDDPVPHDDTAYLAWMVANAKDKAERNTNSSQTHRSSIKAGGDEQNVDLTTANNNNNNNKRASIFIPTTSQSPTTLQIKHRPSIINSQTSTTMTSLQNNKSNLTTTNNNDAERKK